MKLKALLCALALTAAGSLPAATLTFQLTESGPDVVLTTSGALEDSSNWLFDSNDDAGGSFARLVPISNYVGTLDDQLFGIYTPVILTGGPGPLGSGFSAFGTHDSGPSVVFSGGGLVLPANYSWGDPLESQGTFAGQTFATLGLNEGTYTWTAGLDTIEVKIGGSSSAVPEGGSTLAGLALVLAGLVSVRRSVRR
jgi:hypothetical protein